MAHWAKINEEGVVETVLVTSNDEADEGYSWLLSSFGGTWIKTSYNTKKGKHLLGGEPLRMNFAQPGALYIAERDAFTNIKFEGEEQFILHEPTLSWVPAEVPADATYAMPYGPEPDWIEQETIDENGETVIFQAPQISETDNSYVWISSDISGWWLNPNVNYPKPEGEFYWNGFDKEWQAPIGDKPSDNHFWDVVQKQWIEALQS